MDPPAMDPGPIPDPMDVDPVPPPLASPTASTTGTSTGGQTNESLASNAPIRPPRRSAALAAQAALASTSAASADDAEPSTGGPPSASSGPAPDKWTAYLADCRAQSLFTSRPLRRIRGHQLTTDILAYDFVEPFFMTDPPAEIGMTIPAGFSPDLIAAQAGGTDRILEIINVADQSEVKMSLADWVAYFKTPKEARGQVLNLLSLEISQQPLGQIIGRPWVVRQMDLVSRFWPTKRQRAGDMPQFQLYCLMGTEGSFTDFHVDFGGTSVFYHIISGQKTFLFIQPTPANLRLYDTWVKADVRTRGNLADQVSEVLEVHATAGQTLWIPSGWIHAVHTPVDTLVVGGNFLTSRYMASQIGIHLMESAQSIDAKFLLPNFSDILWYALDDFAHVPADRIDVQQAVELVHLCAFLALHPLVDDPAGGAAAELEPAQPDRAVQRFPLPPGDLPWDEPAPKILRACVQRAHRVLDVWNPAKADRLAKVIEGVVRITMCAEHGVPLTAVDGVRRELDKFVRVAGMGGGPGVAGASVGAGAARGPGGVGGKRNGVKSKKSDHPAAAPAANESDKVDAKGKAKTGKPKPALDALASSSSASSLSAKPPRAARASDPSSTSRAKSQPRKPAAPKPTQPLESAAAPRRTSATTASSPLSSVPSTSSTEPPSSLSPNALGVRPTRAQMLHPASAPLPAPPAGTHGVHDTTSDLSSEDEPVHLPRTRARVVVDVDALPEEQMDVDMPAPPAAAAGRKRGRPKTAEASTGEDERGGRVLMQFELHVPGAASGGSGGVPGGADGSAGSDKEDVEEIQQVDNAMADVEEIQQPGGAAASGGRRRSKRSAAAVTNANCDNGTYVELPVTTNRRSKPGAGRGRKKTAPTATQPFAGEIDLDLIAAFERVVPSSPPPAPVAAHESDSDTSPAIQLRASARLRASSSSSVSASVFSMPKLKQSAAGDDPPPTKRRRKAANSADSIALPPRTDAGHAHAHAAQRRGSASSNSSASSSASARRRSLSSAQLGLPYLLGDGATGFTAHLSKRRAGEIEAEAAAMLVAHVTDEKEMGVYIERSVVKEGEGDVTEDEDEGEHAEETRAADPEAGDKQSVADEDGMHPEDDSTMDHADETHALTSPVQTSSRASPSVQVVVEVPMHKHTDECRMRMLAEEAHKVAAAVAASGDGMVGEGKTGGDPDPDADAGLGGRVQAVRVAAGVSLVPYSYSEDKSDEE